jgi:hypothetical protein
MKSLSGTRYVFTAVCVLAYGCSSAAPATPQAVQASATPAAQAAPSATASAPPQPTPTFPPDIVAAKPSDIAGAWPMMWRSPTDKFMARLRFQDDSTFTYENAETGSVIFSGTVKFADGKVTLENKACDVLPAGDLACSMTFVIHSSTAGGRALRLLFESADDQDALFIKTLDGKTLYPTVP